MFLRLLNLTYIKLLICVITVLNILLFFFFLFSKTYPTQLMMLHLCSFIALWGIIFYKLRILKIIQIHIKEIILLFGIILLSFFIRIDRLGELSPGLWGDELAVATYSQEFIKQKELPPFVISHPYSTPVTYAIGQSIQLFGHTVIALKLPIAFLGALSVGLFYIFLRLYMPISFAILGALLMTFEYTQIVLSRLAYEPIPSLFFQILSAIFVSLYHKTKNIYCLLGLALSLGGGLYTYLNFRLFAVLVIVLTILLIYKNNPKQYLQKIVIFLGAVIIITSALISFQFNYPQALWSRASEISIFSQHYSQTEFVKEFWGNISRTGTFFITGDPNPEHNPAGVSIIDPITTLLALIGFIYLFKTKRKLFLIALIFMLAPFISDIFSVERISEFHYYGLGHPHALRVSGWIFLVLFTAIYGIFGIYNWGKKKYKQEIIISIWILVAIVCFLNWNWYFNQLAVSPKNYYWNYYYHNAAPQELINYISKSTAINISVSKSIFDSDVLGFHFFIDNKKVIKIFELPTSSELINTISNNDITAIEISDKTSQMLQQIVATTDARLSGYTMHLITDPAFNVNHIIYFTKSGF